MRTPPVNGLSVRLDWNSVNNADGVVAYRVYRTRMPNMVSTDLTLHTVRESRLSPLAR